MSLGINLTYPCKLLPGGGERLGAGQSGGSRTTVLKGMDVLQLPFLEDRRMEVIFQRPKGGFLELLTGSTYATVFFLSHGDEETLLCDNPSSVAHGCGFSNYIVVLKNIFSRGLMFTFTNVGSLTNSLNGKFNTFCDGLICMFYQFAIILGSV